MGHSKKSKFLFRRVASQPGPEVTGALRALRALRQGHGTAPSHGEALGAAEVHGLLVRPGPHPCEAGQGEKSDSGISVGDVEEKT